ncbi:MAG TPA: SRPBCC family protein [Candidatus Dormibacteraeota bacterium]|nr:SRPBCC family protein [Candidatus Dormibacteraeota bacterium]
MARITFATEAWTPASPSTVYDLLKDGATWPQWSPIGSFRLEREGGEGGESAGAIRVFSTGTVRSREELIELRPGRGLSYVALSGLPVRDHRADVVVTPERGGSALAWHEAFRPVIPGTGWLLRPLLRRFVQRCADGPAQGAADREGSADIAN